ncbi:MAG: hypothetical protein ABIW85_11445 [Variovorax sp.]
MKPPFELFVTAVLMLPALAWVGHGAIKRRAAGRFVVITVVFWLLSVAAAFAVSALVRGAPPDPRVVSPIDIQPRLLLELLAWLHALLFVVVALLLYALGRNLSRPVGVLWALVVGVAVAAGAPFLMVGTGG